MFSEKKIRAAVVTMITAIIGAIMVGLGADLGVATLYVPGCALIIMAIFGFFAIAWADE